MSTFEFNKILAAIILALVVVVIIGKVGNLIMDTNKTEQKETAYKIDIPKVDVSTSVSATTASETIESISALLATASLENGGKIYKKCAKMPENPKCPQKLISSTLSQPISELRWS